MKETYKRFEIEVSSKKRFFSDEWVASAKFRPAVASVHSLQIIGNFKTQAEAEAAVLEWAKKRIDLHYLG